MFFASRIAFFRTSAVLGAFLAAIPAFPKGIAVRFLPNPPEDSVVAYRVLRADGPGLAPALVGEVPAAPGRDTLSFSDTGAIRGLAYVYSIIGLNAGGGASDPSESTEVALPSLSLPDTLHAGAHGAQWSLALGVDPLSGASPLALSLEDSSRFTLRYDPASRQAVFAARAGAVSGWAVVRAVYYGKFADRDSVWLDFASSSIGIGPGSIRAGSEWTVPSAWSPSQGALRIRGSASIGAGPAQGVARASASNPASTWSLLTARGETVASLPLPGDGSETLWDGRDAQGRSMPPACYLWAARGSRGALLRSGSLRILP